MMGCPSSPKQPLPSGSIEKLPELNNPTAAKHSENVYWLQLELDTTKKEKEAVEECMTELYRDMEDFQGLKRKLPIKASDAPIVAEQRAQFEKYERMLRVMNNQIAIVRNSSDSIVQSLKDEISDLMDEKARSEVELLSKLSTLSNEKRELEVQLETKDQEPTNMPPRPPIRQKSLDESSAADCLDNQMDEMEAANKKLSDQKSEIDELVAENKRLRRQKSVEADRNVELERLVEQLKDEKDCLQFELETERTKHHDTGNEWKKERETLQTTIAALNTEISSQPSEQILQLVRENHEKSSESLDRLAKIRERADSSIHSLQALTSTVQAYQQTNDSAQLLSVLETATMVHTQVKVSLMLLELNFRNGVDSLRHDQAALASMKEPDSPEFRQHMKHLQKHILEAVVKVETVLEEQVEAMKVKSVEEGKAMRCVYETKLAECDALAKERSQLRNDVLSLRNEVQESKKTASEALEMFVNKKALETLQHEVIHVVEKVKEKDEVIGDLEREIEEYKVRERTVMGELKRHIKEQGDRQLEEQQQIMQRNARLNKNDDGSSVGEEDDNETEYDEKTVDESMYEDQTIYEEITVL